MCVSAFVLTRRDLVADPIDLVTHLPPPLSLSLSLSPFLSSFFDQSRLVFGAPVFAFESSSRNNRAPRSRLLSTKDDDDDGDGERVMMRMTMAVGPTCSDSVTRLIYEPLCTRSSCSSVRQIWREREREKSPLSCPNSLHHSTTRPLFLFIVSLSIRDPHPSSSVSPILHFLDAFAVTSHSLLFLFRLSFRPIG
jgi:hypothetical protein